MNPVDRFQALIRHSDYRNDPRLAFGNLPVMDFKNVPYSADRMKIEFEYGEFLGIWGLRYSVDPENQESVKKTLTDLRAGDCSIFAEDLRVHDQSAAFSGQFLTLKVSLEHPTKELLELIRRKIDIERTARGIKTKRKKHHNIDPWDVWDKAQAAQCNLLQVTHSLCKVEGDPAYDQNTKRAYDQVQRAYRKAVSMIEAVGNARPYGESPAERFERQMLEYRQLQEYRWLAKFHSLS
ncbi:MAG: hypothetical protein ABI955_04950 [Nitrospirota bacterium]